MCDRIFLIAFGASLSVHLLLLVGELLSLHGFDAPARRTAIDVVYEEATVQQELVILQEQLARAKRETVASPSPSHLGGRAQIRIPERPSLTASKTLDDIRPERGSIVDLTDLVDASRGDPVLLSYFSAIRQQIQYTANHQAWLPGNDTGGLVYVSFELAATGEILRVGVVADRSIPSEHLREVAVRIIQVSAPFPAFPPSIQEPSQTLIVPLDFLISP